MQEYHQVTSGTHSTFLIYNAKTNVDMLDIVQDLYDEIEHLIGNRTSRILLTASTYNRIL
jgi:hypothetical protein